MKIDDRADAEKLWKLSWDWFHGHYRRSIELPEQHPSLSLATDGLTANSLAKSARKIQLAPVKDQIVIDSVLTCNLGDASSRLHRLFYDAALFR